MTDIHTGADIDIVWRDQDLSIRIPLDGEISQEWARRYLRLARNKNIPARAEDVPSGAWIVIALPASADRSEVVETLEAARDLIAQAGATEESSPDHDREIATAVRDWWAQQRD